ncbi:MAG TPA: hypothetical protein VJ508_18105, partial [Saprospiraceae bacterium]|nr:hypothetical protein [Saprospiraceae bacterium]
ANPSSMELAIQAFSQRFPTGWVIVGDMKELGDASQEAHLQIIKSLLEKRFNRIFLVGPAFGSASMVIQTPDRRLQHYPSIEELKAAWNWTTCEGQSLLLKGSRSMHLEKLLES